MAEVVGDLFCACDLSIMAFHRNVIQCFQRKPMCPRSTVSQTTNYALAVWPTEEPLRSSY